MCVCLYLWPGGMHVAPCGGGVGRRLVVRCTCLPGDHTVGGNTAPCYRCGRRSPWAVLPLWQRLLDPSPRMLQGGDFGRRPESPACQAPPVWRRAPTHRRARGGLGCAERRPLLCYRCGNGRALASARATAVATRARAHLRERVETRHPPACCLWPRSRHRPAAAKAVSLRSGVMPANREYRSAASCAAIVATSVCACPCGP